jgi:hypothetical protein
LLSSDFNSTVRELEPTIDSACGSILIRLLYVNTQVYRPSD